MASEPKAFECIRMVERQDKPRTSGLTYARDLENRVTEASTSASANPFARQRKERTRNGLQRRPTRFVTRSTVISS